MTRQNKNLRVFVFTLINAVIALLVWLSADTEYAVLLVPILNELTKYINVNYFNDIGVEK